MAVFSKEARSKIMQSIKGKDTTIELEVGEWLKSNKIKFRKHYKIIGTPDFVILNKKVAIFVDGDFWHGHYYKKRAPKLSSYWRKKIRRNMKRDKKVNSELKRLGWHVIRVWENTVIWNKNELDSKLRIIKI